MAKIIRWVVFVMLTCLVSRSSALPSIPSQPAHANEPQTLLGKPYRRLWGLPPSRPQSRRNLAAAANDGFLTQRLPNQDQIGRSSKQMASQPCPHVPPPLRMNALPESRRAVLSKLTHANHDRERKTKTKLLLRLSKSSDQNDVFTTVAEQIQPTEIAKPGAGAGARRDESLQQRSSRLYDRGAWTSRLPKEY
ncbi:hypothetical protein PAXINDRAFT_14599 [Paxillus involutus ATCC 200175]|uniref:Unplaced genomic scaffold PAXINscaffold_40, whole genome shotgun sequence n=1 Tax=Paxillus involutus ATCC 200175 TaxID=664439 RepID=A0A0C9TYZ6_PAXIN|nr:hypothetical protein PAXINDRAFT_14599 [Paxillus involutus ATCC 200175]